MEANEQTVQQIERTIKKIIQKFPNSDEPSVLTDIHLRVAQDSGELLAFDDDDNEIARCVVEQWIDNKDDDFYDNITSVLRKVLNSLHGIVDDMGIIKPYSYVLEDDEKNNIAELYVSDDDTIIIGGDLMQNLDKDLDEFMKDLLNPKSK